MVEHRNCGDFTGFIIRASDLNAPQSLLPDVEQLDVKEQRPVKVLRRAGLQQCILNTEGSETGTHLQRRVVENKVQGSLPTKLCWLRAVPESGGARWAGCSHACTP